MRHIGTRGKPGRLTVAAALVVTALLLAACGANTASVETRGTGTASVATAPSAARQSLTAEQATKGGVAYSAAGTPEGLGAGTGTDAFSVPQADKLIVRNKTMRLEVSKVPSAIDSLRKLASTDGADITQLQVATSDDQPIYRPLAQGETMPSGNQALQAFMVVRVPADKYQSFIDEAAKLGTVLIQTESTDDVTQQHIDLKARLDNLRAEEAQLRSFFVKAKNVSDMLQIEQELARVRGEIESMAAQVAYLERQAAMATVTLELVEPKALVRPSGIDWGVGTAFTNSVRAFVNTLNVLIVLLGPVLALLVFVALPILLIARLVWALARRRRAARAQAVADAETAGDASSREA